MVDVGGEIRRIPVVVAGFLVVAAAAEEEDGIVGLVVIFNVRLPATEVPATAEEDTFLTVEVGVAELIFFWRTASAGLVVVAIVAVVMVVLPSADDVFLRALAAVGAVNLDTNDLVLTVAFFVFTSVEAAAVAS